jgi:hypothetical protein
MIYLESRVSSIAGRKIIVLIGGDQNNFRFEGYFSIKWTINSSI